MELERLINESDLPQLQKNVMKGFIKRAEKTDEKKEI